MNGNDSDQGADRMTKQRRRHRLEKVTSLKHDTFLISIAKFQGCNIWSTDANSSIFVLGKFRPHQLERGFVSFFVVFLEVAINTESPKHGVFGCKKHLEYTNKGPSFRILYTTPTTNILNPQKGGLEDVWTQEKAMFKFHVSFRGV